VPYQGTKPASKICSSSQGFKRRVENNLEGEIFTVILKPGFAVLSAEAITTLTQYANKMLVFVCRGLLFVDIAQDGTRLGA